MTERVIIEAEPRTVVGKQVKQLRREGLIPGVIYGQSDPLAVQFENRALRRALRQAGGNELIDVQIGGQQKTVIAREIQQHPTRGDLVHVDFYEVNLKETITTAVDLVLIGVLPTTLASLGSLTLALQNVEIECLPGDLISEIEVDLAQFSHPEHALHVRDLRVPAGVTILTDPEQPVTSFSYNRVEVVAEEEGEDLMFAPSADAVEVIKRGKGEDEEF